jgi:hypothetical protein
MNTHEIGTFDTFEAQRQVRDSKLTKHAKAVAVSFLTYADAYTGIAFPSVQTLANGAGISASSARKGLRELKQASPPWLETVANAQGGRASTTYRFVMRTTTETPSSRGNREPNARRRQGQRPTLRTTPPHDTQPSARRIPPQHDASATPAQHDDELLREHPSETAKLKLTTTTNTSEQQRHELPRLRRASGDGIGAETLNRGNASRAELQDAIAVMPSCISPTQHVKLAKDAIALASQMDGVRGSDIVAYLDNLTKTTNPQARAGSFVNALRAGKDAIDEERFAGWMAEKPKREMLRRLTTTTEGKAEWDKVFTPDIKRRFATEHMAMNAYVDHLLGSKAKGGAA